MGLLIYGSKKCMITAQELLVHCSNCGGYNPADVLVNSVYLHVYWLPVFPFEKEAHVCCQACGSRRDTYFDKDLASREDLKRAVFRHPWYTYAGAVLLASPFIIGLSLHFLKL